MLVDFQHLRRCCGTEPEMQFYNSSESWEKHIKVFQELIRTGWKMPPLIAVNDGGILTVNDGNHRLEAMVREGLSQCWVIIWDRDSYENIKHWKSKERGHENHGKTRIL